jgi:hypothetical protein
MRFAFAFGFVVVTGAAGCGGGGDTEHYDNLPDCVVDHTSEGLNEPNSITTCLLDHLDVSFATQAECEAYVNDPANGGYTASATQACTDYFAEMQ